MAASTWLEQVLTGPKPVVLPLNYEAICRVSRIYTYKQVIHVFTSKLGLLIKEVVPNPGYRITSTLPSKAALVITPYQLDNMLQLTLF